MISRQCEVLIVGAGPAGIAAACAAAETGRSVVLLDNMPRPGGQIWRGQHAHAKHRLARQWMERLARSGAEVITQANVFAAPQAHVMAAETPAGTMRVMWQKLILATGARELFLPFPGWTLPNVMGVGGLQAMAKSGWPTAGKRVVVAGSGPLLLAAAAQLVDTGASINTVAEQAGFGAMFRFACKLPGTAPAKLMQAMGYRLKVLGTAYRTGCWIVSAHGDKQVEHVTLTNGQSIWEERCDYLACSFGLTPSLELPLLLGCQVEEGTVKAGICQETSVPEVYCAGEPTGIGGADAALVEGQIAGYAAAGKREAAARLRNRRDQTNCFKAAMARGFALRDELRHLAGPETIVCRCEDVTRRQMEGHPTWRSAKLHTRCGMGACQGRICGGAARVLFGWHNDSIRPPALPASVSALAEAGSMEERTLEQPQATTKG